MTITATLIIVLTFSVLMHLALVAIILWPLEPLRSLRSFAAKLSHPGRASRRAATQTPALQPTTNGADAPPAPFLISRLFGQPFDVRCSMLNVRCSPSGTLDFGPKTQDS